MSNKRAIVCVVYGDPYKKIFELVQARFEEYAKKCKADLIILDKLNNHVHPVYIRFDIETLLDKYDQILHLDIDVVISKAAPDIFSAYPTPVLAMRNELSMRVPSAFHAVATMPRVVDHWNAVLKKQGSSDCVRLKSWNRKYYNAGIFVISPDYRQILALKDLTEEFVPDIYSDQGIINFELVRYGLSTTDLNPAFNTMHLEFPGRDISELYKADLTTLRNFLTQNYFFHYGSGVSDIRAKRTEPNVKFFLKQLESFGL